MTVTKSALFDAWADTYDDIQHAGGDDFPFAGYGDVIAAVADLGVAANPRTVLDLGTGTGNLAAAILERAPSVALWGIDFSSKMLDVARAKLPAVQFVQADLLHDLPTLSLPRFDAIVSTYVLHEFPDDAKLAIIRHLRDSRLAPGGLLAIGDIAFETAATRNTLRQTLGPRWDDTEHYLAADAFVSRLRDQRFTADYRQISFCAGVLLIRPT